MRSRKRKASSSRVLITPGKSIASSMCHELAVLFCHAGSNVFYNLPSGSEEWISQKAIFEITGHEAFTQHSRPGWVNSRHSYDLAIVIAPSNDFLEEILTGKTEDPINELTINNARRIDVLINNDSDEHSPTTQLSNKVRLIKLPSAKLNFVTFYQDLFAQQVRFLNGKLTLNKGSFFLDFPTACATTECPQDIARLVKELQNVGFHQSENKEAEVLIKVHAGVPYLEQTLDSEQNEAFLVNYYPKATSLNDFVISTKVGLASVNAIWRKNGLEVHHFNGIRLLPTIENNCCFKRFADYLCKIVTESAEASAAEEKEKLSE